MRGGYKGDGVEEGMGMGWDGRVIWVGEGRKGKKRREENRREEGWTYHGECGFEAMG